MAVTESVALTDVLITLAVVELVDVSVFVRFNIAKLAVEVSNEIPETVGESVNILLPVPALAVNNEYELATPCVVVMDAVPERSRPGNVVPK